MYESSGCGYNIWNLYMGYPTCADDIILLVDNPPYELQVQLTSDYYANRESYTIHPQKSVMTILTVLLFNSSNQWTIGNTEAVITN